MLFRPTKPAGVWLVFALWIAAIAVPLAYLTVKHAVPLSAGVLTSELRLPATGKWRAIHILSPDCGCSRRVLAHLLERRRLPDLDEAVFAIGSPMPNSGSLDQAGFDAQTVTVAGLEAMSGIKGVPWLIFVRPDGVVAYSGGYLNPLEGNPNGYHDTQIWNALRTGTPFHPLPVFGCAIASKLAAKLKIGS